MTIKNLFVQYVELVAKSVYLADDLGRPLTLLSPWEDEFVRQPNFVVEVHGRRVPVYLEHNNPLTLLPPGYGWRQINPNVVRVKTRLRQPR